MQILSTIWAWLTSLGRPRGFTPTVSPDGRLRVAVLVGVNEYKYLRNCDLNGCVNDVETIRDLLIETFGFPPENIIVLTDAQATLARIVAQVKTVVATMRSGCRDIVGFWQSSHGTTDVVGTADAGDPDGIEEALVGYDYNPKDGSGLVTERVFADMFAGVPGDGLASIGIDACHGGGVPRVVGIMSRQLPVTDPNHAARLAAAKAAGLPTRRIADATAEFRGNILAACTENETAAEAWIDDRVRGAMTTAADAQLFELPNMSTVSAADAIRDELRSDGYSQTPEAIGTRIHEPMFGGAE